MTVPAEGTSYITYNPTYVFVAYTAPESNVGAVAKKHAPAKLSIAKTSASVTKLGSSYRRYSAELASIFSSETLS